ncbi:MAG: transcriptional repressor [Candidatus Omnitrophica bacterium]|nr:transcriptional repressor [Candidatus Omnitrophota bacterium]
MNFYVDKIKNNGLKVTPRRKAIINIFNHCRVHLTPEDIFTRLKEEFSHCGLPSVYRNLEILAECGILARIYRFDNKRYYGLCHSADGAHHHHIICIKCGTIAPLKGCNLFKRKKINGFKIIDHFIQVDGICKNCQE